MSLLVPFYVAVERNAALLQRCALGTSLKLSMHLYIQPLKDCQNNMLLTSPATMHQHQRHNAGKADTFTL
jgi:hypothetical protein